MNSEKFRAALPLILGLAITLIAIYSLHTLLLEVHYHDIIHELRALSLQQILFSLFFVALSFAALAVTEIISLRLAGVAQPAGRATLVSFLSQAIVHTTGFGLILGTSLRYRLYAPHGLKLPEVAKAQLYFSSGFVIATLTLLAMVLVVSPQLMLLHVGGTADLWQGLGAVLLAVLAALLMWSLSQKPLSFLGRTFTPPPIATSVPLIGLSVVDLLCCCAIIYILLPAGLDVNYPIVLMTFLAAIVVSLVSHVPGGLGVFEATILLLLAPPLQFTAATVSALLMFRTLYYLLPFLISTFVLSLRMRSYVRKGGQVIAPLAPKTSAILTLIAGTLLIFSGATPVEHARLDLLSQWLPLGLIEISHLTASLVGVVLLVVAQGLNRRLHAAWLLALILCGGGALLALMKGLELGVAILLFTVFLILLPTRSAFYRPSSLLSERLTPEWWSLILTVLAATIWLLLFGYKHVQYRQDLWWQVELHANVTRSLRAALAAAILILILALRALLRPAHLAPALPTSAELDELHAFLKQYPNHQGWIGLTGDKHFLWNAERSAVLMYGIRGRSWIALGEPIGPVENWNDLLWDFMSLADAAGGKVAFYQVRGEYLTNFVDLGLHPFKLGETALVPLADFTLQGRARSNLRASWNKVEKTGGSFEVLPAGADLTLIAEIEAVSNNWLDRHDAREKRFSLGFFNTGYMQRLPLAVVKHKGAIVAFANIWTGASAGTLSIDLMRYNDAAPSGTMDYLLANILLWGKAQGFSYFDLGMAPLTGMPSHQLASNWMQIARLVASHGRRFYNFEGLRAYKEKFDPVWQPAYLMCKSNQLVSILLDISTLISGGVGGLIRK